MSSCPPTISTEVTSTIAKTVVRLLMPYRKTVKTITTDNGSEFASHQLITKGLHMKGKDDVIVYFADAYSHQCRMYGRYPDDVIVYFADAYSSWQKGCVENTNKLIRRYIPKHSNFNLVSPQKIMNIQKKLNNSPGEKLNFDTPKFCFFEHFY